MRAAVQESFPRARREEPEHHLCRCRPRRRYHRQRALVERSAYKDFVDRFVEKASQLKSGDPLEETTDQGAIVSKTQLDKVKFYVDLAQKEGGKIALGGSTPKSVNERCQSGYFFQPTVITDLPVSCRVNREEIF